MNELAEGRVSGPRNLIWGDEACHASPASWCWRGEARTMAAVGFGWRPTEGRCEPSIPSAIIMSWDATVVSKLRPTSSRVLRQGMLRRRRHHHRPQS